MADLETVHLIAWLSPVVSVVAAFGWLIAAATVLRPYGVLRFGATAAACVCAAVAGNSLLSAAGVIQPNVMLGVVCAEGCMALAALIVCYTMPVPREEQVKYRNAWANARRFEDSREHAAI